MSVEYHVCAECGLYIDGYCHRSIIALIRKRPGDTCPNWCHSPLKSLGLDPRPADLEEPEKEGGGE